MEVLHQQLHQQGVIADIVGGVLIPGDLHPGPGHQGGAPGAVADLFGHRFQVVLVRRPDVDLHQRVVRNNVAGLAALLDDAVNADIAGDMLPQGVDALLRSAGGVGRQAEKLELQDSHGQRRTVHPVGLPQVHLVHSVDIPKRPPSMRVIFRLVFSSAGVPR